MNYETYLIALIIGVGLVCIGTFRPLFQDWDKPVLNPLNIGCIIIGFLIIIAVGISQISEADKEDKQNAIYFDHLKSDIRSMDCKDLGNYLIDNSDNQTLIYNQIIGLAHNIYGVKCK